jgi:apolipoprotein N-acyltransferase
MTRRTRAGLAAAYAAATAVAFPQLVGGDVLDLGLWVSWLAPACLLLALADLAPRRAALLGFAAALPAHAVVFHWIYVVTVRYGHAPPLVGVLAPLLLAAWVALFVALFAAVHAGLARRGLASPLAAAALWTALEHARASVFTGFPWASLGYAQHENAALLGLASVTGVYGLSFVVVLTGAAAAGTARALQRGAWPGAGVWLALALVIAAHPLGLALRAPRASDTAASLRVAVLQGDIDQGVKWRPSFADRTLEIYRELTARAAERGAQLVVWPETAVPGALEWDPELRVRIQALAREQGVALLVGGVGISSDGGMRPAAYYDSAFVIDATGVVLDRYDKTHLVPFGEFVPFQRLLDVFFRAFARGIAETSVTPGDAPRALDIALPDGGAVRAGVPICYELLFPDLVRRFAADGAQLLLAVTNDAWYGRTGAPYQFLAITALRAAESQLWLARAANTGVSAFIDPRGEVRAQTPIFERGLLVADVPLGSRSATSFYVRHGDLFAFGCWALLVGLALQAAARGLRAPRPCTNAANE